MGRAKRTKPKRLPDKLLRIREALGLSCEEMIDKLEKLMPQNNMPKIYAQNIRAYEVDEREPSMITLLAYARLAGISLETLVDDELNLPGRLMVGKKSADKRKPRSRRSKS